MELGEDETQRIKKIPRKKIPCGPTHLKVVDNFTYLSQF